MKNQFIAALLLLLPLKIFSRETRTDSTYNNKNLEFKYEALIIPAALTGYGLLNLENHTLNLVNAEAKEELSEHIDEKVSVDDFSQYSPFVAVYALNAAGIKGNNNFRNSTTVLFTAYLIMGGTVNIMKRTGPVKRPDGTAKNSFPSGHTATAFMGAEFLYQEYKEVSPWYGISGYAIAAGTGFFRMYNDRHWFSDVAAGAGIGMLSTKIAYWIHPCINRIFFKEKSHMNGMIIPFHKDGYNGLEMYVSF